MPQKKNLKRRKDLLCLIVPCGEGQVAGAYNVTCPISVDQEAERSFWEENQAVGPQVLPLWTSYVCI